MSKGVFKGELCNRDGCTGVIEAYDKEGCCSCHISAPCSYCTTQTEYCPKCGWSAEEEWHTYMEECYNHNSIYKKPRTRKTDEELYNELPDGEFGYIHVESGGHTITRLKGKHNGMSRDAIFEKLGIASRPCMPMMKMYDDKEFELTYFND